MSNIKIEYDIVPPDKGKGKAVPNNTAQGGSGHEPPREWESTSCLSRWNENDDRLQSHSVCRHLMTRSDDEETWDELTSEVNRVATHLAEIMAEAIRRAEGGHAEMQASIASLHRRINTLRKSYKKQGETSHSWDSRLQTRHTRNDELGPPPHRDSRPIREGHEQDGLTHRQSNEPNDRSQRLSPQNSQRNLDEETQVDVVARSWREAECWEQSENDAAKCHRKALDCMIQAADKAVEYTKTNNFLRQEVINAENELAKGCSS